MVMHCQGNEHSIQEFVSNLFYQFTANDESFVDGLDVI